ncbi:hypothetical protein IHE45_18G052300 [Dioscorea alata]|uniref:Uncharacterized protein n=1 Tax=Dioscorea alata TaxID=55571 RepID=A0ACB7U6T6_DIOAL|nr:hypothetical protein IHE45_18G052300 [Dioscorea alata]
MLAPSSKHLLNKLAEIPSDVLWNIGDEDLDTRIRASNELFNFVNMLEFKESRQKILTLIEYLVTDLMSPGQPHYRKKGGIVGLAVLTVALNKRFAAPFLHVRNLTITCLIE